MDVFISLRKVLFSFCKPSLCPSERIKKCLESCWQNLPKFWQTSKNLVGPNFCLCEVAHNKNQQQCKPAGNWSSSVTASDQCKLSLLKLVRFALFS